MEYWGVLTPPKKQKIGHINDFKSFSNDRKTLFYILRKHYNL